MRMTLNMNQPNHIHPTVNLMSDNYLHHNNYVPPINIQTNNTFHSNNTQNNNIPSNNPQIWSNPNSPFAQMVPQANQMQHTQNQQSYQFSGNVNRPVRTHDSILNTAPKRTANIQNISSESNTAIQAKHFSLMNRNKQFTPVSSKNNKIKRSEKIKCIAALQQYQTYCKEQIRIHFIKSGIQSPLIYPTDQAMTPEPASLKNRINSHYRPNQNTSMAPHQKSYEYVFKQQLGQVNRYEPIQNVQGNREIIGTVTNQQTNQMQIQPNQIGLDMSTRNRTNSHQYNISSTSNQVGQVQQNNNAIINVIGYSQLQPPTNPNIPHNNSINNHSIQNCSQVYQQQPNLVNPSNFAGNCLSSDVNTCFIWLCLSFPKQFAFFNKILLEKLKLLTNSLYCPSLFPQNNYHSNIFRNLLSTQMNSVSYNQTNDLHNSIQLDTILKSNQVVRDFASLFSDLLNLYEQALQYKNAGSNNQQIKEELLQIIRFKLTKLPLLQPGIEQILKTILVQFYQYASFYTYPCPYFIQSSLPHIDQQEIRRQPLKCQKSNRPTLQQFTIRTPREPQKLFLSQNELPNCGQFDIYPSLNFLQLMSRAEIQKVNRVQIWNLFGKIQFLQPINLYNKNLARTIVIRQNTIQVYDYDIKIVKCRKTFFNYGRYQELTEQGQDRLVDQIRTLLKTQKMKLIHFDAKYGDLVVEC